MTEFDSGTAWVLRRFAKPLVTGSIPATVSRHRCRQPFYRMGRRVGAWLWRKGAPLQNAFFAGLWQEMYSRAIERTAHRTPDIARLEELVTTHHAARVTLATQLSETRDRLVAAQKELSALKRAKK